MAKLSDEELELLKAEAYGMTGVAEGVGNLAERQGETMIDNSIPNDKNTNNGNNEKETEDEKPSPTDPPKVTDKELLTLCNLSNLRLEFGNFKISREWEDEEVQDHTIFSFIDQEYNSIMGERTGANIPRTMHNLDVDENPDDPSTPMYNSIDELKIEAGIQKIFDRFKYLMYTLNI